MSTALLVFSFVSNKIWGLERTAHAFKRMGGLRARFRLARSNNPDTEAIAETVAHGLRFMPLPVECLDQALVTWYALNVNGHAAVLRIGMKLSPVCGHAWVICGPSTFVKTPGLEDFTVVAEFAPWA